MLWFGELKHYGKKVYCCCSLHSPPAVELVISCWTTNHYSFTPWCTNTIRIISPDMLLLRHVIPHCVFRVLLALGRFRFRFAHCSWIWVQAKYRCNFVCPFQLVTNVTTSIWPGQSSGILQQEDEGALMSSLVWWISKRSIVGK